MIEELAQFHFLRPWGLLLALTAALFYPCWHWLRARRNLLTRMIAPHLLPHLLLPADTTQRFSPILSLSALLVIAGLAIAGPTWEKLLPPFANDQTQVSVLIDLSPSMAASQNNTLALAQERIQTLADNQPGWHLGLIAYGHSAHLVMPNSRDTELLKLYLNSLEAGLITGNQRNLTAALATALHSRPDSSTPLTLIVLTDNLAAAHFNQKQITLPNNLKVLIVAPAEALTAAAAQPILDALAADTRALSTCDEDVNWLERRVQSHFNQHQNFNEELKWRDAGYWLVWPVLLLSLLSIRRGWRLQWCLLPVALMLNPATPASAGPLADAFFTSDQQGRLAFEAEQYAVAADLFQDPYLRGLSAYQAADLAGAVQSLRQLDSAPAWFYLGNSYARQMEFTKAQVAYQQALEKQPDLEPAKANLALVIRLAKILEEERKNTPPTEADELRQDNEAGQGTVAELDQQPHLTDDIWLQNLSTSATGFLRRKFAIEQRLAEQAAP